MRFATYRFDDPFNIDNKRNFKNTRSDKYNCAGYALHTYSWINFSVTNLSKIKKELQDYFKNVRILDTPEDELKENELLVACKISYDEDFHFIKRHKSGVWYHKPGYTRPIRASKKMVYAPEWKFDIKVCMFTCQSGIYNSETLWLAVGE